MTIPRYETRYDWSDTLIGTPEGDLMRAADVLPALAAKDAEIARLVTERDDLQRERDAEIAQLTEQIDCANERYDRETELTVALSAVRAQVRERDALLPTERDEFRLRELANYFGDRDKPGDEEACGDIHAIADKLAAVRAALAGRETP